MRHALSSVKIVPNNYIIIKLGGKKSYKFYVVLIMSQQSYSEFTVKFMQKCCNDIFVFSEKDVTPEKYLNDVVVVLKQPTMTERETIFSEKHIYKALYNFK